MAAYRLLAGSSITEAPITMTDWLDIGRISQQGDPGMLEWGILGINVC